MKRFTLSLILIGLLGAACSAGASPTRTPTTAPTGAADMATAALRTTAASPTPEVVTAAVGFDGKVCTYAGPTDLARRSEVTFSLVNSPSARVGSIGGGLAVAAVVDGTTKDQIVKWGETHHASDTPSFALEPLDVSVLYPQQADEGTTVTVTMTANLYAVYAATSPQETDKAYFCALLKVFDR